MLSKGFLKKRLSTIEMVEAIYRKNFMARYENIVQSIFKSSGLYHGHPVNIKNIVDHASPFIPMDLAGEGILTVGSALMNIVSAACGVIAIGPFGCMPNRISEAVLNKTMTCRQKREKDPENHQLTAILSKMDHLPFLAVETDGGPFPQIIEAKLESFLLRAGRLHDKMIKASDSPPKSSGKIFDGIQKVHQGG
jgi:predicted nucleotide-binding protein (sugar kinase/HSP70/actin superfamily)